MRKWLNSVAERFTPKINQISVEFIPIQVKESGGFIPGCYVAKIKMRRKNDEDFYSFLRDEKDSFYFRENN